MINESVLDKPKETLNPILFDNNKLKQDVRKKIMEIVNKYLFNQQVSNIYFIGSNTGYNYADDSDIDIDVKILGINQDQIDKLWKKFPKDLMIDKHPIRFYLLTEGEFESTVGKGSVYDVVNDRWIVEPKKEDVKVPYSYAIEVAKIFMAGIDNRIMECDSDMSEMNIYKQYLSDEVDESLKEEYENRIKFKYTEIEADLDSLTILANMLYDYRSQAYKQQKMDLFVDTGVGNMSIANMVYKILEKFGYKDKLKKYMDLKKQIKGASND